MLLLPYRVSIRVSVTCLLTGLLHRAELSLFSQRPTGAPDGGWLPGRSCPCNGKEDPDVINNVSRHQGNNTLARTSGGAVSRSGARLLLQTATTLSLAGPRRAASGGRSRRRMSVHAK